MGKLAGVAALLVALLGGGAARATWREATSAHFRIYANDRNEATIRAFADKMERYDAALRVIHSVPEERSEYNKLTVYVLPTVQAIARLYGDRESAVAGFYIPRVTGSVAFTPAIANGSPSELAALQPETILFHEYAHHFFFRNYPGAYPAWFVEGYAEFHSTARIDPDGSVVIGGAANHRGYDLLNIDFAIARMMKLGGMPKDGREIAGLYAKGWLLMHYLTFNEQRHAQLGRYLTAIGSGTAPLKAAENAFGDLGKLDHELDRYVEQPTLPGWKLAPDRIKVGPITVRTLSPGEAATIDAHIRSTRGVNERTAPTVLAKVRQDAAPFPNDPAVQAWLAEAATDAGQLDEAEAAEKRALAADPRYERALYYRAVTAAARAVKASDHDPKAWATIRALAAAANRAEPLAPAPLALYYETFREQGQPATTLAIAGLEEAYELAPEAMSLRASLAREYLVAGKVAEARAMLAPIAFDPHGGSKATATAALVARIDAGERDGLAADADKLLGGGDQKEGGAKKEDLAPRRLPPEQLLLAP